LILPNVVTDVAHYWAMLMTNSVVSTSHFIYATMLSRYGKPAVDAALQPYIDAEQSLRQQREWKRIVAFYAEWGMEPSPNHPARPISATAQEPR